MGNIKALPTQRSFLNSMNNEMTIEQQITDILAQAEAEGLLDQATSTTLSADEQDRFMQIMWEKGEQLYADAIQQAPAHLGATSFDDLMKKLSDGFCKKFCEGSQLKEKYRQMLTLGSSEERELIKDVMQIFVTILIPWYPNIAFLLSLYMALYFVRVRLDKQCAKHHNSSP
jgi:hypothetical protein